MVLYEYPHFKISRKLLLVVGQWPYDASNRKYLIRIVICVFPILVCITEIYQLISAKNKFKQILHALPLFCYMAVAFLKYANSWINIGLMRDMLEFIVLDFGTLQSENEIAIMKRSAAEGWSLGKSYSMLTYGALIAFLLTLLIPSILDIIKPLDECRIEKILTEAGYLSNTHGYGFYIIMNIQCVIIEGVMIIIAVDLLFMAVVYYISGMYCITGYRLEHMFDNIESMSDSQKTAVIRQRVFKVVTQQLNIIKGTKHVMSCYITFFGAQILVVVIAIAALLVNIRENLATENYVMVFALSFPMVTYYFAVFVNIVPGQNILNRSSVLLHKIYTSNWYQAPLKSQKLLLIMMQNVQKPVILSAAGLIDMTNETCSKIVQASFSYFMMMSSMQK